jgi:hypothetical protein
MSAIPGTAGGATGTESSASSVTSGLEGSEQRGIEVEAKFEASAATFRALEDLETIEGWRVVERREVRLRDAYWDTPDQRLGRDGRTLRVRELGGAPVGELTLKGRPRGGARSEAIASVPVGSGPADWQRIGEAAGIVEALRSFGILDNLRADVVLINPRRELVLERRGATEILSLDEVRIEGHSYVRCYVELEQRRGTRAGHRSLARSLASRFALRESTGGKAQDARAWLSEQGRPSAP